MRDEARAKREAEAVSVPRLRYLSFMPMHACRDIASIFKPLQRRSSDTRMFYGCDTPWLYSPISSVARSKRCTNVSVLRSVHWPLVLSGVTNLLRVAAGRSCTTILHICSIFIGARLRADTNNNTILESAVSGTL